MTTIDEYIKYYKDTSIKDIGFNQIDKVPMNTSINKK